ncbi:MAG: two-component system sensor histidine kinase NtrB [Planctomycetota bacterium]|jgi:signal transduction histidine kinase
MGIKSDIAGDLTYKPSQHTREALAEQILWLIRLRWIAVGCIILACLMGTHVFPVLANAVPIYVCAALLLLSNVLYLLAVTKKGSRTGRRDITIGMIQVEMDLVLLTAVLHFSGGVANPFFLLYVVPIIIATIILPRSMSYASVLTAILLFGLLVASELKGGIGLGHYPLSFSVTGGLWLNPLYALGAFTAFVCVTVVVQHLTRVVIARMTAKEVEAARNNDVLQAVISAMGEGLIFINSDARVAICNPAAKLWKKNGDGDADHDSIDDFLPALAGHMKVLLSDGNKPSDWTERIEFNTGEPAHRHIEVKSSPVVGIDGQRLGYVIVGQDLTEHRKLTKDLLERTDEVTEINEMLKMSRIEMAQREKMVAIGQMATGIAHEIGNPLASISSVAQYLARKITEYEQKEQLLIIQYHVDRISTILKRMLGLSRPATSEYKWTDINSVIENTLSLINFDKRAQSVTIENTAGADLPMLWLNPQHIEQVFINIFINALDAMNAKDREQEHTLKIVTESKNDTVEVRISDTGIGMKSEVCKRAFESFFTTKEIGKGTGLGLFISYNLVTEVDGTILLESELGKGTTVTIRLPLRPKKALLAGDDSENGSLEKKRAV